MFDDSRNVRERDRAELLGLLSSASPASAADAYAALPGVLARGDNTPEAIRARLDLTVLTCAEGFVESALYQVDELTKDARRVRDLSGDEALVAEADRVRDAVETAAQHSTR